MNGVTIDIGTERWVFNYAHWEHPTNGTDDRYLYLMSYRNKESSVKYGYNDSSFNFKTIDEKDVPLPNEVRQLALKTFTESIKVKKVFEGVLYE